MMPERTINNGIYNYGFNGKEMDNEVKGKGAQYDYGFRIYDSRIGKFLSVDPLFSSYPFYSSYQFAGNSPIMFIDLDGLERAKPRKHKNQLKCWDGQRPKGGKKPKGGLNLSLDLNLNIFNKQNATPTANREPDDINKMESVAITEIPVPKSELPDLGINPIVIDPSTLSGMPIDSDPGSTSVPEFRGQPVEDNFVFNEVIAFDRNTDNINNPDHANHSLTDLANFLKENTDYSVFVAGNLYAPDLPEGHSPEVLNARRTLNGDNDKTALDLMNARATAVRDKLVEMGVNPEQITPGAGNNYHRPVGKSTSFQIRAPRD